MAYCSKTYEMIRKAQQVTQNDLQNKQFTTFQQFFKVTPPPPQLFDKCNTIQTQTSHITPKNVKPQRSLSNKTHESIKDTKRKSVSIIKCVEYKLLKIFARFRPRSCNTLSYSILDQTVSIENQQFTFDRVFDESCGQQEIYETVAQPAVQDFILGVNGTIMAYGQTGSGKTFTMFGESGNFGIATRSLQEILDTKLDISISILEIYKDHIYDLIQGSSDLKLKEDNQLGFYVERLQKIKVDSFKSCMDLLAIAEENRHMAETKLNAFSSRSHLILTIYSGKSKLNLVDLAGSEKVSKTGAQGETLQEAKKINYSLSCLGHVIQCLSQGQDHIPFRDSKLTKLLQDSLSADCRTSIIVACNSDAANLEETISSLKFAQRAKCIKLLQRTTSKKTYRDLELEVTRLQQELLEVKQRVSQTHSLSYYQTRNNTESEGCTESLRLTYRSVASNGVQNQSQIEDPYKIPNVDEQVKATLKESSQSLNEIILAFSACNQEFEKSKFQRAMDMLMQFKQNQQMLADTLELNSTTQSVQQKLLKYYSLQNAEIQRMTDYIKSLDGSKQSYQLKQGQISQMLQMLVEFQKETNNQLQTKLDKIHQDIRKNSVFQDNFNHLSLKLVYSPSRKENKDPKQTKRSTSKNTANISTNMSQKYLRQAKR